MADIFSGSEVVELGIQIEKNGRDFYDTLSKQTKSAPAGRVFEFLTREEEKHIEVFRRIFEEIEKDSRPPVFADDYFNYMSALAGEYVFTQKDKGKEIAQKVADDREAIELAIGFEKDSIIFYEGIKEIVPESDKSIIDGLIGQEQQHFLKLSELRKNMEVQNG